jgi:hypothetical protein
MGGAFTALFLVTCVLADGFGRLYGFDLIYEWAENYKEIQAKGDNNYWYYKLILYLGVASVSGFTKDVVIKLL